MFGASLNEVGLVVFFLAIVLIASKVGKVGERVGGYFERNARAASGGDEPKASDQPAQQRGGSEAAKER